MNELHLFAGAGGGILGGILCGHRPVCAVEIEPYCRKVLLQRQRDGVLPKFPIWDDVTTFDGKPWRGHVDIVCGGFPCQDISAAGKGAGIEGERSGMWKEMARIIGEVLPRFVLVENSPMLVGRGLGLVLGDLAEMGYDARWGVVGAHHAAAPHKRDRIWIVAHAKSERLERQWSVQGESKIAESGNDGRPLPDANRLHGDDSRHGASPLRREQGWEPSQLPGSQGSVCNAAGEGLPHGIDRPMGQPRPLTKSERSDWWATEPDVGRVAHGVAARVDRLRAIGNGQVPAVVRLAWNILKP